MFFFLSLKMNISRKNIFTCPAAPFIMIWKLKGGFAMKGKRKIKIQVQFFIVFLALAALYTFILSSFFYTYTASTLLSHEKASFASRLDFYRDSVDYSLKNLNEVSIHLSYSDYTNQCLRRYLDSGGVSSDTLNTLTQLFDAFNISDSSACMMYAYDLAGNGYGIGAFSGRVMMDDTRREWADQLVGSASSKIISAPFSAVLGPTAVASAEWYISVFRALNTKYGTLSGYTETMQTCKTVFKQLSSAQNKNRLLIFYAFDQNGNLVYPYKSIPDTAQQDAEYYLSLSGGDTPQLVKSPDGQEEKIVARSRSSFSGWTFLAIEPSDDILASTSSFTRLISTVLVVLLLFSLLLAYLTARWITKPMYRLLARVRGTTLENLSEQASGPVSGIREIEELNESFSETRASLKASMDRLLETRQQEIKSRLMALQSQMNPHCYYNSLATIMCLAEERDTDTIIQMSKTLSELMHYSSSSGSVSVPLEEELEYVQKYLYCMKIRYQDSFRYSINVPADMRQLELPKLMIQPLVENCLKYGINCQPPWTVQITGARMPGKWLLTVRDSGPGFSDAVLQELCARIEQADCQIGMPIMEISGLGILNVYLRWKLFCGGDSVFDFGNLPEGGCFVQFGQKTPDEEREA